MVSGPLFHSAFIFDGLFLFWTSKFYDDSRIYFYLLVGLWSVSFFFWQDSKRDYWGYRDQMGETISTPFRCARKCRKLVLVDLGRTDIWVMPWQVIMLRLWRTTMEGDDSLAHLAHASFGEWSMGEERKTFSCQIMMNEIVMKKRTRQITCHFVFFFLPRIK